MPNQTFHDLFRRSEWQDCERRVIAAARECCENCGAATSLRVFHSYYERDREPWDYPPESLHALCEGCKREAEEQRIQLRRQIGRVAYVHADRLMGYARTLEASDGGMDIHVRSYEHAQGVGDATGVPAETILRRLTPEDTISSDTLAELREAQQPHRLAMIRGGD